MKDFKGTPGPWRQGVLLNTPTTNKWSREDREQMDSAEKLRVFANFHESDCGKSRTLVAKCRTPENAKAIAALPALIASLQELLRFDAALYKGAEALQYPDNFLKAIGEAKAALSEALD